MTDSRSELDDRHGPPPLPHGRPGDPDGPLNLRLSDASTSSLGQTFDAGAGRIFPCDSCGADLGFHIGDQALKCKYCGHIREIELDFDAAVVERDYEAALHRLREWHGEEAQRKLDASDIDHAGDSTTRNELRCDSCGGNVEFIGTLTSQHCPYCGSPMQLENAHKCAEHRIPVDGVLPFQIDHEHARKNLSQWVDSRWFAPNRFRKQGAEGKFNGIYLSYFTIDSMTYTAYTGQRGEHYWVTVGSGKNRRREMRTRWYPASGRFQRFLDDVLVLANTGLNRKFMLALEPWPLLKVVPFNQQMLAGYLARTYDIELDVCFQEAKGRIDGSLHSEVCQRIGGDAQQVHSLTSRYEAITFKHLLLPAWLMAYRYNGKTFQVFINAATGEVQGERPYSVWKILFAVVIGVAVVAGIAMTQQ
jgi:DNA-directed RNA polymerase subunit RPC12/RpoP